MKPVFDFFWKLFNKLLPLILKIRGNRGLLPSRFDFRDHIAMLPGVSRVDIPTSKFQYQFNQNPFNICSFASTILALSEQIGVRLSVRFMVALAQREGYITGDGFSYQRASLKILKKYGAVRYEDCPDETTGLSYEEYSEWKPEYESLLKKAEEFRITSYEKLVNEYEITRAVNAGYVPTTASKWFQGMFNPFAPDFFLQATGKNVGGHAYRVTGYRTNAKNTEDQDLETPQTFGALYGDNGKAWSATLFGVNYYDTWIVRFNGQPKP